PQYSTATLSSGLTAAAWNGTSGGVLAIDVSTTLTLGGTVSVDGLGFRGGAGQRLLGGGGANTDFVNTTAVNAQGNKGEGISGTPRFLMDSGALLDNGVEGYPNGSRAKGAPGTAGGGGTDGDPQTASPNGNDQNTGGGGGANGGVGGTGGLAWDTQIVDGGLGGAAFAQASACRIVMGGGGGQGTVNNDDTKVPFAGSGSAGGGIAIFRTRFVTGTGAITANGADAYNLTDNDGGGGAGAGGTIVFSALSSGLSGLTVSANGGRGGDAWDTQGPGTVCVCTGNNHHGPGGGGGGGIVYLSSAAASISVTGGAHGVTDTDSLTFGSSSGAAGTSVTNMTPDQIPGVFSGAQCTPTAVAIEWFKAETHGNTVRLKWRTGYEVDNLGFNVYRDLNGERVKVNPSLVAGSALITRSSTLLTAGRTYAWFDNVHDQDRSALYWLEDIDLHGKRTWHGPVGVESSADSENLAADSGRAMLLTELGRGQNQGERIVTQPSLDAGMPDSEELKTTANLTTQSSTLAGMPAIKISVRTNGWYSVTKQSLVALGLDPQADPRTLQMFLIGNEIPISVLGTSSAYTIEFYGMGANTESTDLQVYWLIWGFQQGMRMPVVQGSGSNSSATSFPYTVQVLERSVYFPGVLNGDKENFFGSAVTPAEATDASIPVTNLDVTSTSPVTLQVALQAVTDVEHQVQVSFNGTTVGDASFSGITDGVATFSVPGNLVKQGANDVSLLALAGDSDISLIDSVSLTYRHTLMADGNSLQLATLGSQILTIGGFTNPNIRAFDITNPNSAIQLSGIVKQVGASFSIIFSDPSPGSRTVLAFSNDRVRSAASLDYNTPSNWGQPGHGADMVIITQRAFFPNLAPLVARRSSQGLTVAVIDVVDLYDEFNFGQKDPQAIKSFLAYASANWRPAPRWVLMAGDASYDPKDYLGFGDFDLVPSKLIATQQLETASDDWFVDFTGAGLPSMAIGRLPVRTTQQTDLMVGKILAYENTGQRGGALLVTDVSDDYNFAGESLLVKPLLPATLGTTTIDRGTDATADSDLINAINQGQKIVNYAGHGSVDIWRGDLLTDSSALSLINGQNLPFFSLMTCLNGAFNDPVLDSLAESLLKAPQGGAVAVWASSGITDPSS
ncbi:MAG: C25 family cysteine peptidase, partial [Blastocatellia bacterium]